MENINKRRVVPPKPTGRRLTYNELLAENKKFKAALEFYGDPESWHYPNGWDVIVKNVMAQTDIDPNAHPLNGPIACGHKARVALKGSKNK